MRGVRFRIEGAGVRVEADQGSGGRVAAEEGSDYSRPSLTRTRQLEAQTLNLEAYLLAPNPSTLL